MCCFLNCAIEKKSKKANSKNFYSPIATPHDMLTNVGRLFLALKKIFGQFKAEVFHIENDQSWKKNNYR